MSRAETAPARDMRNPTPRESSGRHGRGLASPLAALTCAVVIAACGSSSKSSSVASTGSTQGLAFARCMRSHGVPNFPDPGSGGGIEITPGSGISPFSPAFKAAQSACRRLLPGGGPGGYRAPSALAEKQELTISQCMRAHGVTGFPDPTTSPPSSPSGYSAVIGRGGAFLAVPDTINTSSPVFIQAAGACGFGVPGRATKTATF